VGNDDPIIAAAEEDLISEANAELKEKLRELREEIILDVSSAEAENRRARIACDTAQRVRDQLWERLQNMDKGRRELEELQRQIENLRAEREYLSMTIAEETRALKWMRRQNMEITKCRRMELESLQRELHEKELNLADLMEDYEEILRHGGGCGEDVVPEVQWLCHKCVNQKYPSP
jgi:predicted RNase H-like nuclease (RuvC/YqgF family)